MSPGECFVGIFCGEQEPLLRLVKNWPSSCDRGFFIKERTFPFLRRFLMSPEKGSRQQPLNRPISDEAVFKVVKEIVVKFIEVGRLTPTNFEETYERVYETVKRSVQSE